MAECKWCDGAMPPSKQTAREFCKTSCRAAYHNAARSFGIKMHREGAITIEALRRDHWDGREKP
jgi:hypothetical protein